MYALRGIIDIEEDDFERNATMSGGGPIKNMNDPHVPTTSNIKDQTIAQLIPDKISQECSLVAPDPDVCLSAPALGKLAEEYKIENPSPTMIIEEAKEKTGCDSQKCLVGYLPREMKEEEQPNFKVEGPNDTRWLSNIDIDRTLAMWAKKFPNFYHCHFSMVDYDRKGDELANIDLLELYNKQNVRTFGCVINTDKYSGRGQHWMALFVDMRNTNLFTVEFFNSSGNQPQMSYGEWLVRTKNQMSTIAPTEIIKNCKVRHQNSKTECGVYSLFYIYARLKGTPASYFSEHIVDDKLMMEMRLHLFYDKRKGNAPAEFNYSEQFKDAMWEPDAGK